MKLRQGPVGVAATIPMLERQGGLTAMETIRGELSMLLERWFAPPVDDLAAMLLIGSAAVGATLCIPLAVRALLPREAMPVPPGASLAQVTRNSRLMGQAVALVFFGGLGIWAAVVPLASAAIAYGVVSPDGYRKTVQHLEGGIVQAIHVREGDKVRVGDPLLTLQDTQALAEYQELSERFIHLRAREARLMAEQVGAQSITFPPELSGDEAAVLVAGQQTLFESRRDVRIGRERILAQQIAQLEEEIAGLEAVIAAENEQLDLIGREIAGVDELYQKGLERLPRLLALQRDQANMRAQTASNRAAIARNRQKIGEAEMQRLTLRQQDREEVSKELNDVRAELARIRSQLPSRADVLKRTLVRAPIDGTVMNIRVTTEIGGVLRPGAPILDIVPAQAKLIIDARVKPVDIDIIVPGMKARVLLTAYQQRSMPQILGDLRSISADRLVDEKTGEPYFLAKVEVDPEDLAGLDDDVQLLAGMPADVMILTGQRTVLDYLLRPLIDSVTHSFRER